MTRHRALLLILTAFAVLLPGVAGAQEAPGLRLTDSELTEDGATRLVVSLTGGARRADVLDAAAFRVTENGEPVGRLEVTPLLESETSGVAVALVVDRSGSTQGAPLAAAKAASRTVLTQLQGTNISVGIFSFGESVSADAAFGTDATGARSAIEGLRAGGETAMYDAVRSATTALADQQGQRHLLLFSDGGDTVSTGTLQQAIAEAEAADVAVRVVALETPELDSGALQRLAAGTGGSVATVRETGALSAAFRSVTDEIAGQYVIAYTGETTVSDELEITISANVAGQTVSDQALVSNPRVPAAGARPAAEVPEPGLLGTTAGLYVGIAAAFSALLMVLLLLAWSRPSGGSRALQRSLKAYTGDSGRSSEQSEDAVAELTHRAGELVDRLPKPEGLEERLQLQIDRAGWSLRASELLAVQGAVGLAGFLLGWALTGGLVVAVLLLTVAAVVPRFVLQQRVTARHQQFMEQLPDTLGMIAGSLRAGYGLVQAVDTVAKEAPEPTASEFSRAVVENRLGRSIDEALEGLATRIGDQDFAWVVMAINIQREVGGNLAELLDTVASTLRGRAQLRRHVQTLTAEGRLSMWILLALPVGLALYLLVVSPEYIGLLLTTTPGRLMLLVSLMLNAVGYVWMRRLIAIEV